MYRNGSSNYNSSQSAKDTSRFHSTSSYSFRDSEENEHQTGGGGGDYKKIIQETKNVRNESLMATRDAVSRLHRTEQSAGKTLDLLDSQSDKLHKAKTDLDVASAEHKVAEEQIGELKRLNKWFGFKNPFKSTKAEQKLAHAKAKSQMESRLRDDDETRASRHASRRRHDETKRAVSQVEGSGSGRGRSSSGKSHNNNNNFESDLLDDEDRVAEAEIDQNLDEISSVTSRLKIMALGMSDEVDSQNKMIDKLGKNADEMNVRVGMSSNKVNKY